MISLFEGALLLLAGFVFLVGAILLWLFWFFLLIIFLSVMESLENGL